MKFTVSQSSLMKALSVVSKGMGANSTLPILSGIYIKAADGTLEFQTNNLTISIRHLIPANVEEPGGLRQGALQHSEEPLRRRGDLRGR